MGAGQRTELIVIERETRTRVRGGDFTSAWAELGRMWAEAAYIGGSESASTGALRTTLRYRFTVPAEAVRQLGVTPADRILWNGGTYNIREVPRRMAGSPELSLIGETGVPQ